MKGFGGGDIPPFRITTIMVNDKEAGLKKVKVKVIKRAAVQETLSLIPHGATARFARRDLGKETSVRAAVSRLNTEAGVREYSVEIGDYGMYYDVTRL